MDLIEVEDIKKRWQEYTEECIPVVDSCQCMAKPIQYCKVKKKKKYTEELYKKDLHNPDNHNDVITHLEPDILECEVKWALGSISMNKASGGDRIPVELFQILKNDV